VGCRAWWRKAAAMLVAPARRRMVMARLRRLAMMRGPLAVRTCERSSSTSKSRTQSIGHHTAPSLWGDG
jgi:hypothetical protein